MNNIIDCTVSHELCVGCGICAVSCPISAVSISFSQGKYFPNVDTMKCINCGKCSMNCPNSFSTLKDEAKKVVDTYNYLYYGLNNAECFLGYVKDEEELISSASGGAATYIAEKMLKAGICDAVIHAKAIEAQNGEEHYSCVVSRSISELKAGKSTKYSILRFDECLNFVLNNEIYKLLVIGTPCVIRGVNKFFQHKKEYLIYSIALACSHNVSSRFTDYLAKSFNIGENQSYLVNMRDKVQMANAHDYNILYYQGNDVLKRVSRFKCEFTLQWRNYSFSMPCCNACSDFWGYTADITVKDAWGGKWQDNSVGKNVIVVRNHKLFSLLDFSGMEIIPISTDEVANSQKSTVLYKQGSCKKKMSAKRPRDFDRCDALHFFNACNRDISNKLYETERFGVIKYSSKLTQILKRLFDNRYIRKLTRRSSIK